MSFAGVKAFEQQLEPAPKGFKMPGSKFPWSITAREGRFLYEITKMATQVIPESPGGFTALEIATGFGYSGAWMASGVRDGAVPQGKCRFFSVDSYVEEASSDKNHDGGVNKEAKGIRFAQDAIRHVEAQDFTRLIIGSSPGIFDTFIGMNFDVFYLDGHHLNGQPLVDFKAASPHMLEGESVTLFHDAHVPDVRVAIDAAEDFYKAKHYNPTLGGFNLVAVTNCAAIQQEFSRVARICRKGDPYR